MNKKLPKIVALLSAITLTASLAACSSSGNSDKGGGVITINYAARITDPNQNTADKAIVDAFNKKFTGKYKVVRTATDDATYKTKQVIMLRSSTPPDVFYAWEGARAKAVIDAGLSEPLDKYYSQYHWAAELSPAGVTLGTFGGKKQFVPTQMSSSVIWYRPDIFKAHNISVPKTFEELKNAAEALKGAGVAPFLCANKDKWPAQFDWTNMLVANAGVDTYNDLVKGKIRWTDPRIVHAWSLLSDYVKAGYYYPNPNSMDLAAGVIPFSKGEAAMWIQGNWMMANFRGDSAAPSFPVDYFPVPAASGKSSVLETFAENTLMISSRSKNKDAAAAFIDYYVSEGSQAKLAKAGYLFPSNVKVDLAAAGVSAVEQRLAKDMKSAGGATFMHVDHAFAPEVANTFLDATQGLIGGTVTPEQAAKRVQNTADQAK